MANSLHSKRLRYRAKVGIFMPCYNMGPYLDEAIKSLLGQTYTDFTIIIADDASPSKDTTEKLSKIDLPNCQIFYEKKNLGLTGLANKYMSKLDADYIMLFSPDDKMHPDFLKKQVEYLDSHPTTHAVCTWIQEFGDGSDLIRYDDKHAKLPFMLVENHFSGAALMRKTAWIAAGKHDTDKGLYPNLDYVLWLSMLEKGFELGTIPEPLFYWRIIRNSLSHGVNAKQAHTFRKALLKRFPSLYKENSEYVIGHYLEVFYKFEEYYATSEEGRAWLNNQYESLTSENSRLNVALEESIQRPYVRSLYRKVKSRFNKRKKTQL